MKVEQRIDGEPCWFDLMTPDREVAKKFYAALFGWEFTEQETTGMPYSMARRKGEPVAGMGPIPEDKPFPSVWTVYFRTSDVVASAQTVKEAGGAINAEPFEIMAEGKMAVCADREGGVFGLWEPGQHQGTAFIGEHGSMCWCEANLRDAEKGREFYSKVLGVSTRSMDYGGMAYFTMHGEGRDYPQAGILQMTEEWGDMPAHWMAYFAVDDTDAACETIKNNGGDVKHGPFDTKFGRMAVVADPAGAVFTVIKPANP